MTISDKLLLWIALLAIALILDNLNARISTLEHNFDGAISALVTNQP